MDKNHQKCPNNKGSCKLHAENEKTNGRSLRDDRWTDGPAEGQG